MEPGKFLHSNESSTHMTTDSSTELAKTMTIADVGQSLLASLDGAIKRNAIVALGRLINSTVEIPVAWLDSISANIKADTAARVKLTNAVGLKIAENAMPDEELVEQGVVKYTERILRERKNINAAVSIAMDELKGVKSDDMTSDETIDEDWLNAYENEVSQKSTKDMQELFGKILAGKIKNPEVFSIKTLRVVSQLDSNVAKIFKQFCDLSLRIQYAKESYDVRALVFGENNDGNPLGKFGLPYFKIKLLEEYGLVNSEYTGWMDYSFAIHSTERGGHPFSYLNATWVLLLDEGRPRPNHLRLNGPFLTRAGCELHSIVDLDENEIYTKELSDFLKSKHGVVMKRVIIKDANPIA